jgi:hypothetical protein
MAEDSGKQKTERIGWLCVTMVILGLFLMLTKINACALACNSCNKATQPDVCKDEFFELGASDGRYSNNNHSCTPGARVEVVASPPAPKPGIMCHCINNDQAGPGAQDAGK